MKLPIDTSAMQFIAVMAPKPEQDFTTKEAKLDKETGAAIWSVQVAAMAAGSADILKVNHPGDPHLEPGTMVRLHGLIATPYTMADRSGVSFRAEKIEPLGAMSAKKSDG